jgi:hypothetical protein
MPRLPPRSHDDSTVPQQVEQTNIIVGPPLPSSLMTPTSEFGDSSLAPVTTSPPLPVYISPL